MICSLLNRSAPMVRSQQRLGSQQTYGTPRPLRCCVSSGGEQAGEAFFYHGEIAPCPATTLRGLLPNVSALAMISLRLAPKHTLKRRSSSSSQKRHPPCSPWNWV